MKMATSTSTSRRTAMFSLLRRAPSIGLLSAMLLMPLTLAAAELDDASAKKLFNDRGCNACHEAEGQRIGPPYLAVALRYSGAYKQDPQAQLDALAAKIRFGGAGAWGFVPMISNPNISEDEAQDIARWILDLKPAQQPQAK